MRSEEVKCLEGIRTIAEIPRVQAQRRGTKPAVVSGETGETLSYAELDERCRRFAAYLGSAGVGRGERVAILLPNVPEFAVSYFGAIAAGCVAVPVNVRLSPGEIEYILSDCGARAVVTTTSHFEKIASLPRLGAVRPWLLVDGKEARGAESFLRTMDCSPLAEPFPASPGDLACLLYTSGTTGYPKGAMISHSNALFNVGSCRTALGYGEDDRGLVSVPLFHVTGLHSQLVALLACGGTVVLQREYDTRTMLELIAAHKISALFFVPAIYKLITLRPDLDRIDLSAVRVAAYGGAPMDRETIAALRKILPADLHNCYGLTECSSLATVLPSHLAEARADSVGFPVPGTQAQVRGEDGRVLPPGEAGELWLKGPHIVKGYFGAPKKTAEAIRDGWLKTGDVARIDAEGLVYILDRLKDMINRGGEKIYGLEVENVLFAIPGVAEAAVIGIPHPVFGEVPAAYVVPAQGAALVPEAIREFCRSRLADYKVPVEVRIVDRLPRNPGGKVLKAELRRNWAPKRPEEVR